MEGQLQDNVKYTDCFIAYIDILGFSGLIKQSEKDENVLPILTRALNVMAEVPSGTKESRHQDGQGNCIERRWQIQTRSFSDHIIIFMPKESGSISNVLFMVRYLHDRMLELQLCIRGAVTIGGMFWDEAWSNSAINNCSSDVDQEIFYQRAKNNLPVTLGPGLIYAYKLESECAVYPRVIISRELYSFLEEDASTCYPLGSASPNDLQLKDFVRKDADGLFFLDMLHPKITRNDTERIIRSQANEGFSISWQRDDNTHQKVMENVKMLIDKKLESTDEKIRAKYGWLKSYYGLVENQNLG